MTYNVNASFAGEAAKLTGSFPINMYVVNASLSGWEPLYYVNMNQDVYGYSLNSSGVMQSTATIFTGLPLNVSEMNTNTSGDIAEVTLSVPNTDRGIEAIIQDRQYLRGREIYFIAGFAKHLPSGSTAYHIGTSPDKNSFLKEKLFVDSVSSNEQAVSFTCRSKFSIKNIVLPRRTFSKECTWAMIGRYAATECAYDNTASYPTCDGSLDSCRIRGNSERFGGFPSIPGRGIYVI